MTTVEAINILTNELSKHGTDFSKISDGYHTFEELYEFRLLYNALLFNAWAELENNPYNVYKSKKHYDGKFPFDKEDWFIVFAELPTGQISNHYEMKYWDYFKLTETGVAVKWDGHTSQDVADRMRKFLTE